MNPQFIVRLKQKIYITEAQLAQSKLYAHAGLYQFIEIFEERLEHFRHLLARAIRE